jgi:hypothetical protein
MTTILQSLQTIPVPTVGWLNVPWIIWSGVISAVVASGVAAFTAWTSSKNSLRLLAKQHVRDDAEAERQRQHDAVQKDKDRKGAIRREVYASALEETHALLGHIGALSDRPLNIGNDSDCLQSFLRANAKIWLVADAEAAHLSRDLAGDFAELFLNEMATTYPIRMAMEPIRKRREEIMYAESEARRVGVMLSDAKARSAGHSEQVKLTELAVTAHDYTKSLELIQQHAMANIAKMRMESFNETFGRIRPVQRELVKLVSALRGELNLPPDEEKFMEQLYDMERRAWTAINKAFGIHPPSTMPEIAS